MCVRNLLSGLFLLCTIIFHADANHPECSLEPEGGLCYAYLPLFYYNATVKECLGFIYGGCGGNNNRFDTKHECEKHCKGDEDSTSEVVANNSSEVCSKEPEMGPCRAHVPSFFYNATAGECQQFLYGGCKGNGNNFKTAQDCFRTCKPKKQTPTGSNSSSKAKIV